MTLIKSACRLLGPAAIIIGLGAVAYWNSFRGGYFLDDFRSIGDNLEIRSLSSPAVIWNAPLFWTHPVVGFSLALNYRLNSAFHLPGVDIWSYHLVNLSIHLLAGLTLFGIIRRSLGNKGLKFTPAAATWLALLCGLLWTLHPLQVQAVTYIIQRGESLMGLFYLLLIYCLLRGAKQKVGSGEQAAESSERGGRLRSVLSFLWLAGGFMACALGMGTKEVMFTAPLAAWLYDRAFLAGSFWGALRQRWLFYLGLALTMPFPVWRVLTAGNLQGVGSSSGITHLNYAITQFGVILHYLWVSVCPLKLCLDYWWPVATSLWQWQVLPGFLVVTGLLAATVWALFKRPAWGFVGVWFFLILSVTSSVIPIMDVCFEHRMYLPLAAVVVAVVLGAYSLVKYVLRLPGLAGRASLSIALSGCAIAALAVLALAWLTVRRNQLYQDDAAMWTDVINKSPSNARAFNNLGVAYLNRQKYADAESKLRECVRLCPGYWWGQYNLGRALEAQGNFKEAVVFFNNALRYNSGDSSPRQPLATCYNLLGVESLGKADYAEAETQFRAAVNSDPTYWPGQFNLGKTMALRQEDEGALQALRQAIKLIPNDTEARSLFASTAVLRGAALCAQGKWDAASAILTEALGYYPGYLPAVNALAEIAVQVKRLDEQQEVFTKTLKRPLEIWRANPADITARNDIAYWSNNFGLFLMGRDKLAEAEAAFRQVLQVNPDYWAAIFNLGLLLSRTGATVAAGRQFSETLRLNPSYVPAQNMRAGVLNTLNNERGLPLLEKAQFKEAETIFREAVEIDPSYWPAWHNLGKALHRQGRLAEAISAYQNALRLNPSHQASIDFLNQATAELKAQKP